jgi:1,4-alpha-glucan branching enzyme
MKLAPILSLAVSLTITGGLPWRAVADLPVTFRYADDAAASVEVAGEFSNWKTVPLTKNDAGLWTKTLHLKPGTYGYKFVVNGEWIFDPKNPARKFVNDVENSLLTVGDVPPPVSTDRPGVVQFRYTDAQAKTVHVAGTSTTGSTTSVEK